MAEIIQIADYFKTCENCVWDVPPQTESSVIGRDYIGDHHCGHPGGWTPRWIGEYPYTRLECNEFKRKRRENNVTV